MDSPASAIGRGQGIEVTDTPTIRHDIKIIARIQAAACSTAWRTAVVDPRVLPVAITALDRGAVGGGCHELRILLGLVILVQGFETSRYLGSAYDAPTRVRTMRWAQWLSTAIYLAFMLLVTRYFSGDLPLVGGETAIIDMLAPLGALVLPVIVVMALASQLSAAVADTSGAGGLIAESTGKRVPVNLGHLITALVAIAITWSADIYQIIAYASQAFVAYYGLQSVQAALSAWRLGRRARAAVFVSGVVIALLVIVFAVPAVV